MSSELLSAHVSAHVTIPLFQALGALDRALQQNLSDLTVRAELHFSKGNQLREMNLLDQAFKVPVSSFQQTSPLLERLWAESAVSHQGPGHVFTHVSSL